MNPKTEEKSLENFFEQSNICSFKKKEVIVRADDEPAGVYFVKTGFIRQYVITEEGQEFTVSLYKPSEIFPLSWALNDAVNRSYFECMTFAQVHRASKEKFLEFVKNNPSVFYMLVKRVINREDVFAGRMEYLAFGHANTRVAAILLLLCNRFGQEKEGTIVVRVPLTHRDIASMTGLTRETVSLEMKKLEDQGVFIHKGHCIHIKDIHFLKQEAVID